MPEGKYDDEHRLFVQGLMAKGILSTKEVYSLLELALESCKIDFPEEIKDRQKTLLNFIHEINETLSDLDLTVRKVVDEDDGANYFILMNLSQRGGQPSLAGLQNMFTGIELEYLRVLTTAILESDEGAISSMPALQLVLDVSGNESRKYSMVHAEDLINRCADNRWLKIIDNNMVALGVRFIGEMDSWIAQTLGEDTLKCEACRKIIVRGVDCSSCEAIYHRHCAHRVSKATAGKLKCLRCSHSVKLQKRAKPSEENKENHA